jgi:putative membrane protein
MGPLPAAASGSFSAHMTLHMGIVAVAAPLLAAGLAGSALDLSRGNIVMASPILASAVELVVVWGWHAPALHAAARAGGPALILEQASFLIVGVWLWLTAFGGSPVEQRERRWSGVAALILTSIHMTLLGSLFSFTPRALYAAHGAGPATVADQHLGGGIMLLAGGLSYLIGGLVLARAGLREPAPSKESL